MAKKILSILCALTMLVTMVSVAAFSASAADSAEFNLLSNISKWTVNRQSNSTYSLYAGAVDLSSQNLEGIDGVLALLNTNSGTASNRYVDFNYSDAVAFGDDFSILMTAFIHGNINKGSDATDNSFVALNLGDYSVRLVRYAEDANKESAWGRYNLSVALYKNDVCLAATDCLANGVTTTLYDGKPFDNAKASDNSLAFDTSKNTSLYIANNCHPGSGTATTGSVNFKHNANWKDINVVVRNGIMTISDANGNVLITEAVAAGAFASVTPSVRIYNDAVVMKGNASALFRLEGVINSTGSAPEGPTTNNFAGIGGITPTVEAYGSTLENAQEGSGITNIAALSSDAIVAARAYVTADLGTYSIGDEFTMSFDTIKSNAGISEDGTKYAYITVLTLGDLKVEFVINSEVTNNYSAKISIYYNNTLVNSTVSGGWYGDDLQSSSNEYTSIFTELETDFPNASSSYSSRNMRKVRTTISYANGKVIVTYGLPSDGSVGTTLEADISDADFSNASMTLAAGCHQKYSTILYNFSGSYTEFVYNANSDENLKPYGASLTVNDSLAVNFIYEAEQVAKLAADYTNFSAVATVDGYSDKTVTFTEADIDSALGSDGKYYFTVDLITPDLFSKDIVFTVTATKKTGGAAATYVDRYSVRDYCVNMINSEESYATDNLKNLCYSILEYGEATREYMKGNDLSTTNLSVNKGLNITGAWIGEKWAAASETDWNKGEATGDVAIVDAVMNLAGNVGIKYGVTVAGDASEYNVVFEAADKVLVNEDAALVADGERQMAIARVYAYNMDAPITAVVKDASNESVSNTYTTSVEGWVLKSIDVGNLTPDVATDLTYGVFVEMLTYGNAAKAYAVEIGLITVA